MDQVHLYRLVIGLGAVALGVGGYLVDQQAGVVMIETLYRACLPFLALAGNLLQRASARIH